MKYFTDNPLERMMMQVPKGARHEPIPPPPEGHHCYGCSQWGDVCMKPCPREIMKQEQEKKKHEARDL
ncbi:MAG: hypothetical protein PHE09_14355 [Oscillospiraceae bacterium]|nr:hypothetical protein [Oscillospiraceae bacterium]